MNHSLMARTVIATAVLASARMVTQAGAYPSAGGLGFGATRSAATVGQPTPVDVVGTAILTAGASFAKDVPLMVGTDGKVIAHDNAAGKHAIGRSLEAATGDGHEVEVFLVMAAGDSDAIA